MSSVTYRDSTGAETTYSRSNTAIVTTYTDSTGASFRQILPPASFDPRTANVSAMAAFGFNPRPTDAASLQAWDAAFANWKGFETTTPSRICPTGTSNTTWYFNNWSGGIANGETDYRRTYATMRWPQFYSTCGSLTGYQASLWAGLGGHTHGLGLLQVGSDTDTSVLNQGDGFWEAITASGHDTGGRAMALSISNQDLLLPDVYYQSGANTVTFNLTNQTSGLSAQPVVANGTIDNYPLSNYYDGTTAEIVHERPTYNKTLTGLRQWQYPGAGVSGAKAARAGMLDTYYNLFPHVIGEMTNTGYAPNGSTVYPLSDMPFGFQSSGTWSMGWEACS